ncbi:hypothetical protein BVY00_02160, partial [bacterium G20]
NKAQGNSSGFNKNPNSDLPSCNGTNVFSVAPAVDGTYDSILPLGNTSSSRGTAGHVMPVDHLYFNFLRTQPGNFNSPTLPATIVAPGDIEIYKITATDYLKDGVVTGHDYSLYYSACKEVTGYLGHIDTVDSVIQNAIDHSNKKDCNGTFTTGPGSPTFKPCTYSINLKLKAGDNIGTAGGAGGINTASFDFGTYDARIKPLAFIDPKYWTPYNQHAVCGLNYYPDGAVKTSLLKKLQNTKLAANGLPDCGTNMWDKAGTAQGNWVLPNTPTGNVPDNQNGLAVIHLNTDPSQGNIDWGGTIAPADRLKFPIVSSGLKNRDPAEVTADGQIYCFQDPLVTGLYSRSVLLQLIDSNTLKAEYSKAVCSTNPSFSNPTTYVR